MEAKSVQTLVYEELKRSIMSMKLVPGQAMSTQEIATKLNVSRTPVREAFLQLQSEGLVEMIPQRETVVSRIDIRKVEQEKFIRECLELGVINKFLRQRNRHAIEKMWEYIEEQKKYSDEKNYIGFLGADDGFHRVLFDVTGQEMAWATINSRNGHYNRLRILFIQSGQAMESSMEQHAEIVKLLEKGEEEAVSKALTTHIQRFDVDKMDLIELYPDYFNDDEGDKRERRIGRL